MPPQTGKVSDLLKKTGAAKAFDSHKADETDMGFSGGLPGGITGGRARLTKARLDTYKTGANKGKPYMLLSGVVLSPKEYAGQITKGQQAMVMVPLCEDPPNFANRKTVEDQIAIALNEMRKLGVETSGLDLDDWEAALENLVEEAPEFKFSTQATVNPQTKKPTGKVKTYFNGKLGADDESAGGDDAETATEDATGETAGDDATTEAGNVDASDESSWEQLGEAADNQDADAIEAITTAAAENGIDTDDYPTWAETAAAVWQAISGGGGDDTTPDPEPEPEPPKVGATVTYKKMKVKVLTVDKKKATCVVQDNKTKKKFEKVKFSELS